MFGWCRAGGCRRPPHEPQASVCPRTARKWIDGYCRETVRGLSDRSSRPHRLRSPTLQP
ncbi:leucine zipper domain-containing protein [Bradyrhizobium manausense]|uniref:leucine zipper domain-containing protein n=1 Tax=Bradyrhizobium manausense TaxID=989370 RepID=UPI0009F9FADD